MKLRKCHIGKKMTFPNENRSSFLYCIPRYFIYKKGLTPSVSTWAMFKGGKLVKRIFATLPDDWEFYISPTNSFILED